MPDDAVEPESVSLGAVVQKSAGDGYGNKTASLDVPVVIIIPPAIDAISIATGLDYEAAGTAHTGTFMIPVGGTTPRLAADVALNGTVLYLDDVPHDSTGNVPAASDWVVVRAGNGTFYTFRVSSYATKAITIVATSGIGDANGTGVPAALPTGNFVWFMGAPADHPTRAYYLKASTRVSKNRVLASTPNTYEPILFHSDNATAAALEASVSWEYAKPL